MPRIRVEPEDFLVEELPLYTLLGEGMHTFLWVEKRLANTEAVARALARAAGVAPREVGWAGRKDRRAVTRQWFSVPELDPAAALELELRDARVLEAVRHPEKLRTGQLAGNRFRLRVRDVDRATAEEARRRLEELRRRGLSNRFGRQRFGRGGGNVARGSEILRAQRVHGDRRQALLMVAALQSAVFNEVLDRRPAELDQLLVGDVAVVHATEGHFVVADPERERERLEAFEVSPTGPIFGTKMQCPRGRVAELEDAVMAELDLPPVRRLRPPRGLRIHGGRRSLRVRVRDAEARWEDAGPLGEGGCLELDFVLPAGSYATVLLDELFPAGLEEVTGPVADAEEAH